MLVKQIQLCSLMLSTFFTITVEIEAIYSNETMQPNVLIDSSCFSNKKCWLNSYFVILEVLVHIRTLNLTYTVDHYCGLLYSIM